MPRVCRASMRPEEMVKCNAWRKIVADNLRYYCKENGLSQEKLAELCDVSREYVNNVMNCRYFFFRLKFLQKAAAVFRIPDFYLFVERDRLYDTIKEFFMLYLDDFREERYVRPKRSSAKFSRAARKPDPVDSEPAAEKRVLVRGNYFGE